MRRTDVEKTREILRLHDEYGLSQREIAAATGCSLGAVSGILTRAKAAGITYPVEMTAKQLGRPIRRRMELAASIPSRTYTSTGNATQGCDAYTALEEYKAVHLTDLYTQFCQRYRISEAE